jgi:hypothetical protein
MSLVSQKITPSAIVRPRSVGFAVSGGNGQFIEIVKQRIDCKI